MSIQKNAPSPPIPPRASASRVSAAADVATAHHRYAPDAEPRYSYDTDEPVVYPQRGTRWHGPVIAGMLIMLALYWIGSALIVPWMTGMLDHWNTGSARLAHYRLNVGHHGTSDFFTAYLHGEAVVIEFPGGDAIEARTYVIPVTSSNDSTPRIVTLVVKNLRPDDQPGKPDLLVEVEGIAGAYPLYNTGSAFQAGTA
jgi:hypothetical protein